MASGVITIPFAEETFTVTLDTSVVELASWGNVQATKIGPIVFIRFYGIHAKADITATTRIATISSPVRANGVFPAWTIDRALNGEFIVTNGGAQISANHMLKTTNCYVECIFPV